MQVFVQIYIYYGDLMVFHGIEHIRAPSSKGKLRFLGVINTFDDVF